MRREQDQRVDRHRLQREADQSRPKKTVSVVGYLAILFAAAFLLLLLSYFMQQRSNEQAISGLKDSVNSFQSVETLMDTNQRLIQESAALNDQAEALEQRVAALEREQLAAQQTKERLEKELKAMDWFWRIQRAYSRGKKSEAKDLIAQFEATGLSVSLPQTSSAVPAGPSPADQYDAILSALGLQKAEP